MFILILILHLLIPQPAYADTIPNVPIDPPSSTSSAQVLNNDPTSTPTPTLSITSTPTSSMTINPTATIPPSPPSSSLAPTQFISTPTPTPLPILKITKPPMSPMIPAIIKGVSQTFAPDIKFPKSFLNFEKDNGNLYASTQLSPFKMRALLLVSLLLIIIGFGLVFNRRIFFFIERPKSSEEDGFKYIPVGEVAN